MESDRGDLLRCWVEFDLTGHEPPRDQPGRISLDGGTVAYRLLGRGVGVSGYDEADCLNLIQKALGGIDLPPVRRIDRDVDVDKLDIAREVGVAVWRGVWFPRWNLEPGNRP